MSEGGSELRAERRARKPRRDLSSSIVFSSRVVVVVVISLVLRSLRSTRGGGIYTRGARRGRHARAIGMASACERSERPEAPPQRAPKYSSNVS